MKMIITSVALLAFTTQLSAQDFPNPKPTEAHKILAKDSGTWDAEIKMYFQGPTGPATTYKGVETNELVSSGMYSRSTFKSKMGDREFEGHGLFGYDSRSKEYTGLWVDNFTDTPTRMTGKYDAKKKTLTMYSAVVDGSGQEIKQKQVTTYVDDKTKTFAIFILVETGDKVMEIKIMEMTAKKRS